MVMRSSTTRRDSNLAFPKEIYCNVALAESARNVAPCELLEKPYGRTMRRVGEKMTPSLQQDNNLQATLLSVPAKAGFQLLRWKIQICSKGFESVYTYQGSAQTSWAHLCLDATLKVTLLWISCLPVIAASKVLQAWAVVQSSLWGVRPWLMARRWGQGHLW